MDKGIKIPIIAKLKPKNNIIGSFKCIQKVNQVRAIDSKEDLFLVFKHFCFFGTCYRIFFYELQSAKPLVNFTFSQINGRESSATQILQQLEIWQMETVITWLLLNQDRLDGNLFDLLVEESEEIIFFVVQSKPNAMVIGDRI